ncbi:MULTISPECIES: ABC transporter ATP-binding protein [Lysobacter]|uniref:ABC transporter ATP-binding protein/permease n=1 Tax=Lysobacter gummosus TaxID=262324 RepID=A0ABY3X520_9GAMM|nr:MULTISPECIES: ABC transporter ATP-binding protein [Lysobacter]ALN92039.1 ABC transporter family protein [Lysobacter gummosus]UJB21001.1 ABC transporter ATP-binding protein/permease [Lysobacter capsici]UJQ29884.1 ABC transporter ATP-binding protein/permease [Lysobacter gummosus]UNP27676.1 ABC transporter ATP-binding protein/permease [Lysobacter gummosus]
MATPHDNDNARRPGKDSGGKPSLRERFNALRNLPPFLRQIWQTSPALTLITLGLRLIRALLPVVTLYVGKLIIDEAVRLVGTGHGFGSLPEAWAGGQLDTLLALLALEFGLAIGSDLLGRVVNYGDSLLSELFTNVTSVRLMEHAATLDLEDFEDPDLQDKLDRARRQTMGRMSLMSQLFGQVQDTITVISFAIGLLVYAPWLILLLAVALIPAFIGEAHFNALGYSLNFAWTPERRQLEYVRQMGASVETAKEVKIFNLHRFLIAKYRELADKFFKANRALARRRAFWGTLLAGLGTLGYYIAYGYIAWRTVSGDFSIGDLTFLAGSFRRLRQLLEGLLVGFSQVASQALYLDDLFSFFEIKPEIVSPAHPVAVPKPIQHGFVFENVGFRYPDAERWALRGLDFELRAGEVLALVGENGAGKTTLVKLLARLYDPDEGRILLDGRDLRDYDLDQVRSSIGVIFQDFVRYHLTAGENIGVGQIDAMNDAERIREAARRAMADEVIEGLPRGYDQLIGRRFKTGVDLSGGQWQKIAIARAYMRDAQVMILDEPTAALDARAEFEVFQRFKELSQETTAVLISHRFSSVRMADRILVLAEGRLEASGTHEELLAQGGRYAELFELQAAGYR